MSELGIVSTRIIDWFVEPTVASIGEEVRIGGKLERQIWWWWEPLPGVDVEIYIDSDRVGVARTGSDGRFLYRWYPAEIGRFYVKAHYPGDLVHSPCDSPTAVVDVVTEEEKIGRQIIMYIGIGSALAIALAIAYALYRRYEETQMIELLALRKR